MNWAIVGCALAGGFLGGSVGVWLGAIDDRGSDLPMAFAMYGLMGVPIGGFIGVLVGSAAF